MPQKLKDLIDAFMVWIGAATAVAALVGSVIVLFEKWSKPRKLRRKEIEALHLEISQMKTRMLNIENQNTDAARIRQEILRDLGSYREWKAGIEERAKAAQKERDDQRDDHEKLEEIVLDLSKQVFKLQP